MNGKLDTTTKTLEDEPNNVVCDGKTLVGALALKSVGLAGVVSGVVDIISVVNLVIGVGNVVP